MLSSMTCDIAHGLLSSPNGVSRNRRQFGGRNSTKVHTNTKEGPSSMVFYPHTTSHGRFNMNSSPPEQHLHSSPALILPANPALNSDYVLLVVPPFQPVSQPQLLDWAAHVLNATPPIQTPIEMLPVSPNTSRQHEVIISPKADFEIADGKCRSLRHYDRCGRREGEMGYEHTSSIAQQQTLSPNKRHQNVAFITQQIGQASTKSNSHSATCYRCVGGGITSYRNTQQQTASPVLWLQNVANTTQMVCRGNTTANSQSTFRCNEGGSSVGITGSKNTESIPRQEAVSPNIQTKDDANTTRKTSRGNTKGKSQSSSQYYGDDINMSMAGNKNTESIAQQQTESLNVTGEAIMTQQKLGLGITEMNSQPPLCRGGRNEAVTAYMNANNSTQQQTVSPNIRQQNKGDTTRTTDQGYTEKKFQSAFHHYRRGSNGHILGDKDTGTHQKTASPNIGQQNDAYMIQMIDQGYTEKKFPSTFHHYRSDSNERIAGDKNTSTQQQTVSPNISRHKEASMTVKVGQGSTEVPSQSAFCSHKSDSDRGIKGHNNTETEQQIVSSDIWKENVANMTRNVNQGNTTKGNFQSAFHYNRGGICEGITGYIPTNTAQPTILPCWILDPMKPQITPLSKAQSRKGRERESRTDALAFPWQNIGGSRPYQCSTCGKTYKKKHHLAQHCWSQHPDIVGADKKIVCEICGKFLLKKSASRHMRVHTYDKKFKCPLCDDEFEKVSNLARHTQKHISTNTHTCKICCKSFSSKSSLTAHIRIHSSQRFQCPKCDKVYKSKSCLRHHIRTHDGTAVKYRCEICDKWLSTKASLSFHKRIHFSDREYKCEICNKSYTQKHVLLDHMRVHTGEKKHRCDICDKSFTYYSSKRIHMHVHAKPKQNQVDCGVCGKTFASRASLRIHIVLHGEKKIKCPVCGKMFSTKCHLSRHSVVHTGEKKYKCKICGISFAHNSSLSIHKRVHSQAAL